MGADRDARGRFLPGRAGGPGRPRRAVEAASLAKRSEAVTPEVRHDIIATAIDQARDRDRFRAVSQGAGPCDASTHDGRLPRLDAATGIIPEAPSSRARPARPRRDRLALSPWSAHRSRASREALSRTDPGASPSPDCPSPGASGGRPDPRCSRPPACRRTSPKTGRTARPWRRWPPLSSRWAKSGDLVMPAIPGCGRMSGWNEERTA
jgi:hypothetical protein